MKYGSQKPVVRKRGATIQFVYRLSIIDKYRYIKYKMKGETKIVTWRKLKQMYYIKFVSQPFSKNPDTEW